MCRRTYFRQRRAVPHQQICAGPANSCDHLFWNSRLTVSIVTVAAGVVCLSVGHMSVFVVAKDQDMVRSAATEVSLPSASSEVHCLVFTQSVESVVEFFLTLAWTLMSICIFDIKLAYNLGQQQHLVGQFSCNCSLVLAQRRFMCRAMGVPSSSCPSQLQQW